MKTKLLTLPLYKITDKRFKQKNYSKAPPKSVFHKTLKTVTDEAFHMPSGKFFQSFRAVQVKA